ncbi:mas-related G-protein coupled receptor member X1-like [Notamacropus eugenii]|uniref:mas-related G-protein coupled receptor member X1-like n=1 Tax=Notamacropus eugenii TaxID=9315 RepID=UPI003B67892F
MTVSPSSGQQEYVHDNTRERSANESSVLVEPGHFYLDDWMQILTILIAPVGLVGNRAVLLLLGFCIQRNQFPFYILNLAGANALFFWCSFLTPVAEFVPYLYNSFTYIAMRDLRNMAYTVGLSLLAAISTEGCLSVLFPFWYRCHHPKRTSAAVCTLLWALTSLLEVAYIVSCFYKYAHHFCLDSFIIELVQFILLTSVLCVCSLTLLMRVQCCSQRHQPPRLYLLVLLTVLVFLLCVLPLHMGHYIHPFGILFMPYWFRQPLACVNSSVNPFIYFFLGSQRHKRRRETLRMILQRAMVDEQKVEGETRDTPHISAP